MAGKRKRPPPVATSTSAATSSQSSCLRLDTTTEEPAAARPSTMARPMPFVAPVTIVTFPVRSKGRIVLLLGPVPELTIGQR